jgi:glycosyltransferase involved in cell wall biosynthesis
MKKIKVIKLIDYAFQHREQLTEAYDDSNSMRHLSDELDIEVIGRIQGNLDERHIYSSDTHLKEKHIVLGKNPYTVTFFHEKIKLSYMMNYIFSINPDVIHMHGTSAWPQYPIYVRHFKEYMPDTKLIFSPAGNCKGPEEFLECFDVVIVNHPDQIKRMKCDSKNVIVRKRTADPGIFMKMDLPKQFDMIYVAGFVPIKRIDVFMDFALGAKFKIAILGDFSRKKDHYEYIKIKQELGGHGNIKLCDFIPQTKISEFLGQCSIFVWPNIPPENLETNTNRSIIEALACGMPLLLGENAFKNTEYVINGFNGYKYSGISDFVQKANWILKSPRAFGNNSLKLYHDQFSFERNFINFYNELYLNV